ncbi:MAG: ABC transporter substrate-binding protein [Acidimicrobiia bacterium]|nr:ABC transporter substrate-binding protein [Acidimicrobiia bacterium]NNF11271.1 ABC transporter substrate-binding protein [Acidimicrobiia bacterium]NNL69006.1 ABC transporter substrate-binding protein [Acidimicrobiia bacterium]
MVRKTKWFILFVVFAMVAAACGGDDGSDDTSATTSGGGGEATTTTASGTPPTTVAAAEPIEIEFWHAMADDLGAVVQELVDRYNASQDNVIVNATFQGSYDDTYNALLASFEAGTAPNITQNFDLAAQTMFDTGRLVPAYELMAAGEADSFLAAPRDYYSDENGMVALAFNSSTPIVYYNADIFEAAGIDPPAADWDFEDFLATCDAIEAAGTQFCVTFGTVGWYFEQILANSGGLYFDNDNGRTGRAQEVLFNTGQGVEVFDFLTGLIADGHAPNLGSTWSDTDSVFFAKEAAMIFDSTSGARGFQDNADFEVKTAFIPHSNSSDRNGVVIGGAALWLIDSEDDAVNAAAWDFMKFMTEADQQVTWHTGTGYFPVLASLQDSPTDELASFWDENPNFVTAIDQLATTNTKNADGSTNYAVLGGRAGPFPEIRRIIVEAYAEVLDGGSTPQEALDAAAERANQALEDYNAFFQ